MPKPSIIVTFGLVTVRHNVTLSITLMIGIMPNNEYGVTYGDVTLVVAPPHQWV